MAVDSINLPPHYWSIPEVLQMLQKTFRRDNIINLPFEFNKIRHVTYVIYDSLVLHYQHLLIKEDNPQKSEICLVRLIDRLDDLIRERFPNYVSYKQASPLLDFLDNYYYGRA